MSGRYRDSGPRPVRKKFTGKPEHVVNYLFMVAEEAREIMANLGFRTINEMIGHVEVLETDAAIRHWKADGLDLTPILTPAEKPHEGVGVYLHHEPGSRTRKGARQPPARTVNPHRHSSAARP